jgi:hypothetical protein
MDLSLKWSTGYGNFFASRARNISSNGVAITIACAAPKLGAGIEVIVDWPVLLDDTMGLQLCILGTVVRCGADEFAVRYERYEIKTTGVRAQRGEPVALREIIGLQNRSNLLTLRDAVDESAGSRSHDRQGAH